MSSQTIQLLEQALIQANEEQNQEDIEVLSKALLDQLQQQKLSATQEIVDQPNIAPQPQPELEPEEDVTVLGGVGEFLKAIPRGFSNSYLSAAEGLAEVGDAATNIAGFEDAIDSGDANAMVSFARDGRRAVQGALGADEAYQDLWSTKLGEGVGSFASFFGPAGFVKLLGLAGKGAAAAKAASTGALAVGSGAGEQAQRIEAARQAGIDVTQADEDAAILLGAGVGATELVTVNRLLSKLSKKDMSPGQIQSVRDSISSALKTGSIEGTQEVLASLAQDAIERRIYNENLPPGESLFDDFTVGATIGAGADLVTSAFIGKARKQRMDAVLEYEQQEREKHQASVEMAERDLDLVQAGRADPTLIEPTPTTDPKTITPPVAEMQTDPLRAATLGEAERIGVREQMYEYAQKIAGVEGANFPFVGNRFEATPTNAEQTEFEVLDSDGNKHGITLSKPEALELADHLNEIVENKNITKALIDRLDISPDSYTKEQTRKLLDIGLRANSPDFGRFTSAQIDNAAEADEESGFNPNKSVRELEQEGVKKSDYTPSQKHNAKRLSQGLSEDATHSIEDAKKMLGDKFELLSTERRKRTVSEIKTLLASKNISAPLGSKQLRFLMEKFVGVPATSNRRLEDLTKGEINLFHERLSQLPSFSSVTKLPDLRLPNYTAAQFSAANDLLNKNPNATDAEIAEATRIDLTKKSGQKKLASLREDLRDQGALELAQTKSAKVEDVQPDRLALDDVSRDTLENIDLSAGITVNDLSEASGRTVAEEQQIVDALISRGSVSSETSGDVTLFSVTEQGTSDLFPDDVDDVQLSRTEETVTPAVSQEQDALLDDLTKTLTDQMKQYGLGDVAVNVDHALRSVARDSQGNLVYGIKAVPISKLKPEDTELYGRGDVYAFVGKDLDQDVEGYYSPNIGQIFLGIDRIKSQRPDATPEQIANDMISVLDHEIVHALRQLDVFKQNEWRLLSNLAAKKKRQDGRTYVEWAKQTYAADQLQEASMVEEAVAELVRDGLADTKMFGGKPRSVVNKIKQFFERLNNAFSGSGFTSFQDMIDKINSGEIGSRDVIDGKRQSVVRTPYRLEKTGRLTRDLEIIPKPTVGAEKRLDDFVMSKRTKSGQYVGAPEGLDSPQKLGAMRRLVEGLAREGELGRFWYERSGQEILDLVDGDKAEAGKLIQAIAITSPQTPVPSNMQYALQAYYQNKAGQPVRTGMFTETASKNLEDVFAGRQWEGRKTNNFYNNLMRVVDPQRIQGATVDLWMMRAFGFKGDAPTDAQYTFVENEIKKLGDRLGWEPQQVQAAIWVAQKSRMESKPVKKKTEEISTRKGFMHYEIKNGDKVRVIDNPEGHRAIWFEQGMKHDPTLEEKTEAKFDYKDAIESSLAQISWESIPGAKTGHMPEAFQAPFKVLNQYHVDISKAFLDENGRDIVAKELGVLSPGDFEAPGYYEGRVSPGTQTQIAAPRKYKGEEIGELEPGSVELINAYSAVRGILMKQEGVGWHRPFFKKGLSRPKANGAQIEIGRPLSYREINEIAERMKLLSGHGDYNPISTPDGVRLINFGFLIDNFKPRTKKDQELFNRRMAKAEQKAISDATKKGFNTNETRKFVQDALTKEKTRFANQDFHKMIRSTLNDMSFDGNESYVLKLFGADAGYLGNDWQENRNGEGYSSDGSGGRSDLQRKIRSIIEKIQPRIDAVDRYYADNYGWTRNENLNTEFKEKAPEVEFIPEVVSPLDSFVPKPPLISDGEVKQAVRKDEKLAANAPATFIPRINPDSDPYSQAVARNPDEGQIPDQLDDELFSRSNTPDLDPEEQKALDSLVAEPPPDSKPGEAYLSVVEEPAWRTWLDRVKTGAVNRYARVERLLNKNDKIRNHLADVSSISALLMADRSTAITAAALTKGIPVYRDGATTVEAFSFGGKEYKGLIDVMKPLFQNQYGKNLEQLAQGYAIAQRGMRLNAEGKAVPGNAEVKAEVEKAARKYVNEETGRPIIEEWYEAWQAYNRNTVQFLQDTGVLDPETANLWMEQSDYVPFYRQSTEPDADLGANVPKIFSGMTSAAQFKKLEGSEKEINIPMLDAITRNLASAVEMGMKNVAQQRVARDLIEMKLAQRVSPLTPSAQGTGVISFKKDGQKVSVRIADPLIYESLLPVDAGYSFLEKYLGMPATFLREMITRDPGFVLTNMARDTLATWVTSGASFTPVIDTLKNYAKDMNDLEKFGVVGGYDFNQDPKDIVKFINKNLKRRGARRSDRTLTDNPLFDLFGRAWDGLGTLSTRSDFATRKAVYDDVLARTGNEAEAAFQALEVINFGRRGSNPVMRTLTAMIPFLNARLQGLDVLNRAYTGGYSTDRTKTRRQRAVSTAVRSLYLTALTGMYYLLVSDDEQYKDQSDYIKDNHFIIPTDSGVPIRLPIPFEIGFLFKTIPERVIDSMVGDSSSKDVKESVIRGLLNTFELNPFDAAAYGPLVEATMNFDFFTGRPIVPYFIDRGVEPRLQSTDRTTQISKGVSDLLSKGGVQVSPIKIDHLLYGYTGTLGSYAIDLIDAQLRSDDPKLARPMRIEDYPIMRRFRAREFGGGPSEDFFELKQYVDQLYGSVKQLEKEGRVDEAAAYAATNANALSYRDGINDVADDLSELRKAEQLILSSELPLEEKEKQQDELREARQIILRAIVPLYKSEIQPPLVFKPLN